MIIFAVTSVSSDCRQISTCLRIGSKFRCMRSTPTEIESTNEKDFECFASTGVNAPGTMFPKLQNGSQRQATALQEWPISPTPNLSVTVDALCWENHRTEPELRCLPAIIRFLGYNPLPETDDLKGRFKRVRMSLGIPRYELTQRLSTTFNKRLHH